MKSTTAFLCGGAFFAMLAFANGQMTQMSPHPMGPNAIHNLDGATPPSVAQLQAQVQQLQAQLAKTDKTASDAYARSGLALIWINANSDGAAKAAAWVTQNGDGALKASSWVAQNGGPTMQVVAAYPNHKHGYQLANTTYVNHTDCGGPNCSFITGNHIDNLTTTGPQ